MTPDPFSLFAPQVWGRGSRVWFLGDRPTWSVSLGVNSLGEEKGRDKKAWVSDFLQGASFEIHSGNLQLQDGATSTCRILMTLGRFWKMPLTGGNKRDVSWGWKCD